MISISGQCISNCVSKFSWKSTTLANIRGAQGTDTPLFTTHGWVYAGDLKEEEELQGRR